MPVRSIFRLIHLNTPKASAGIAPSGVVIFVSVYAGRSTYKQTAKHFSISDLLKDEEDVMVDREFGIQNILRKGATFNNYHFSKLQEIRTKERKIHKTRERNTGWEHCLCLSSS